MIVPPPRTHQRVQRLSALSVYRGITKFGGMSVHSAAAVSSDAVVNADCSLSQGYGVPFSPLAQFNQSQISAARRVLSNYPLFRLYFECGIDALKQGLHNRSVLLSETKQGIALSIDFSGLTVRTTVGSLTDEELGSVFAVDRSAELHLEPSYLDYARTALGARITAEKQLRYYRLDAPSGFTPDPRCRLLSRADLAVVERFYRRFYPTTIFSDWMLDQPFVALFERGELVSCGGVVVLSRILRSANLGNFLTHPHYRIRGYAKSVAQSLIYRLEQSGICSFLLATTEDNISAQQVYEPIGFWVFETRPQVNVMEVGYGRLR